MSNSSPRSARRAERIVSILMHAYPRRFRARHCAAMTATLMEKWRSVDGLRRVAFWLRTVADIGATALLERVGVRAKIHSERGKSPRNRATTNGMMNGLATDMRSALRSLLHSPGSSAMVVGTLALGIGANVAILSLVWSVLFRPLPIPDSAQVFRVHQALVKSDPNGATSYVAFDAMRREQNGLGKLSAFVDMTTEMNYGAGAELGSTTAASGDYWTVAGVRPAAGRLFTNDDVTTWGADPIAIISYDVWRRVYRRDPHVIGSTIRVTGSPFTVIGVAPAGFRGFELTSASDVWVPMTMGGSVSGPTGLLSLETAVTEPYMLFFNVVARLAPGIGADRAAAELSAIRRSHDDGMFATDVPRPISLRPIREAATPVSRDQLQLFLFVLSGVVAITLLIACVNVASLLLVRARRSERAAAVRAALGATRYRLFREALIEASIFAALSGAFSLITARITLSLLSAFNLPGNIDVARAGIGVNGFRVGLAAALSGFAVLLFGATPAWRSSRPQALAVLQNTRSGDSSGRAWNIVISLQMCLSLILLVGAALFSRTLQKALHADLGFDPNGVAELSFHPGSHKVTEANAATYVSDLLNAVRQRPGIESVAFATHVPVSARNIMPLPFQAVGGARVKGGMPVDIVTPEYFNVLGIPLLRGRMFNEHDDADSEPVIIVNEAAAHVLWPNDDPIGQHADLPYAKRPSRVIGVVRQTVDHDLTSHDVPYVFYPLAQQVRPALVTGTIIAHGRGTAGETLGALRTAIGQADPMLPMFDARILSRQIDDLLGPQRFGARLLGMFGGLALLISCIGLFGVTSYIVNARRREIGIRSALGARGATVISTVLGETILASAIGALLGSLAATALVRLLATFLYGITPFDVISFTGAFLTLCAAVLLASVIPARRALRISPVDAMRPE